MSAQGTSRLSHAAYLRKATDPLREGLCLARLRSGADRTLQRQQQELDPFELSRAIQAKLEHIFQLSQELAVRRKPQTATLQDGSERQLPKAKKKTMRKAERSREKRGKMSATHSKKKPRRAASYVS